MNTEELKKLAMAATPGPWAHGVTWIEHLGGIVALGNTARSKQDVAYVASANPATILALIAERDEAIAELHVIESIINGESITTDAGYDTYRRANFIRRTFEKLDRAQAEIRALELRLLEES